MTELEPRNAAVGLDLVPLLGVETAPWFDTATAAITSLAQRLTPLAPLPALPAHTAFHGWGVEEADPLPVSTIRVFVGPESSNLGSGAPGGWIAPVPLARSWGGWVGLREAPGFDTATVARHEFGHALGLGHSDTGLMQSTLPPGASRNLALTDAAALRDLGWDAAPLHGMWLVRGVGVQSEETPGPDGHAWVPHGLALEVYGSYSPRDGSDGVWELWGE